MTIFSTGPITNRSGNNNRPSRQVTIHLVNKDAGNTASVLIQGYYLNGSRTLYVLERVFLSPNEVVSKDYFADFNAFQFDFTPNGTFPDNIEISIWGKNEAGQLVTTHRLVSDELLGTAIIGAQGPPGIPGQQGQTGEQGPSGEQGPEGVPGSGLALAYGSLYGSTVPLQIELGQRMNFEKIGPFSGTTPDLDNNEIRVESSGIYTIKVSFGLQKANPGIILVAWISLTINGMEETRGRLDFNSSGIEQMDKTIQADLNEGDTVAVKLVFSSVPAFLYYNPSLVITRIA
ncbi:hypothetical protein ACQ0QQ_13560 [Lysinibacillus sphaericus]